VVGVESKCTEFLTAKRKVEVSPRYLALAARGDERASSRWFGALAHVSEFRLLDAYQLIKHYLGLSSTYQERPLKLVYLYWEPANAGEIPIFAQHRDELERCRRAEHRCRSRPPPCRYPVVTALSPVIGYDKASAISHKADDEGTSLRDAALALGVSEADFDRIVQPKLMVGDPRRDLGLEGCRSSVLPVRHWRSPERQSTAPILPQAPGMHG
jgi:Fumarase C C-terminus